MQTHLTIHIKHILSGKKFSYKLDGFIEGRCSS